MKQTHDAHEFFIGMVSIFVNHDHDDFRRETKKLHPLNEILFIALCSILSDIEDWVGMQDIAEDRLNWFHK